MSTARFPSGAPIAPSLRLTQESCDLLPAVQRIGTKVLMQFLRKVFADDQGQDIAEYAVMLAVILVLVIGTVRLIGGNANNAFSTVASTLGNT